MTQFLRSALPLTGITTLALAESWHGHLMDTMCKGKDPVAHTRQCVIGCAKSGLGLLTADGKYFKFDAAGSDKALAALKASSRQKDIKAEVTGKLQGETITLEKIVIH
jgi:hypothetical protein